MSVGIGEISGVAAPGSFLRRFESCRAVLLQAREDIIHFLQAARPAPQASGNDGVADKAIGPVEDFLGEIEEAATKAQQDEAAAQTAAYGHRPVQNH